MIKRLGKAKKSKQGAILIVVVLILALAMIFIATAMLLTQATRGRLYENTMSSQARLTVTSAAEVFLEALETQEITDKQIDAMLAETPARHTNNEDKIKMIVPGVPGMSDDPENKNCTFLDIYYPVPSDKDTVYADFTTVIGDQTENVRIILVVKDGDPSMGGRFKNQIDVGGDIGAEMLRFTNGVGMTAPDDPDNGYYRNKITDNTILLRGAAYEQSSSAVFYSDIVYAPGSVATWGGGNVFHGNMVFLDDAYLSTYSSSTEYHGDFYFVGGNDNKEGLKYGTDAGWGDADNYGNFSATNNFYFYKRTAQNETVWDNQKVELTLSRHSCYFVGVDSSKFDDSGKLKAVGGTSGGSERPYTVTNAGTSIPGSSDDVTTPAGKMDIYKSYDYNPASEPFPASCTEDVLSTLNLDGQTTTLAAATTFDYDNYGTDGHYYPANSEIPEGTEIITHPVTPTYPNYLKQLDTTGGSTTKKIPSNRVFSMGSLDSYDEDGDRIIDLGAGGAYYITAGTSQGDVNPSRKPYVFAINGALKTMIYFGPGEFNLNYCVFAVYNVSDGMTPVVIVLEDGAVLQMALDSKYSQTNSATVGQEALCSAGFLSLNRGASSADEIGEYVQTTKQSDEAHDWTQSNGDVRTYSSLYNSQVRPNMYIYGVNNNKIVFGNSNVFEAYIGIYGPGGTTDPSGFYSSSTGASVTIYGRMEGRRITNGTSDNYCMPYCPAPEGTVVLPDYRAAESKYKVGRVIYYYGDAMPDDI